MGRNYNNKDQALTAVTRRPEGKGYLKALSLQGPCNVQLVGRVVEVSGAGGVAGDVIAQAPEGRWHHQRAWLALARQ